MRAVTRDISSYDASQDVEEVEADLLERSSLDGVFEDVEAAYYLVHSLESGKGFAERDRQAAENFADAAGEAGVDRVVYLGGLGETGSDLSEHLRSRREVEGVLLEGEYDLTVLRAAIVVGDGSASFQMIRELAGRLPVMVTPKWVRTTCQPIAVDDVVEYLVGVLEHPETADDTFEIGGPEVLTYQEMLERTAAEMGKNPLIIPVPVLSPELSVYYVDLDTSVSRSVAYPSIYGLKEPVVVSDDRILDFVQVDLTPFDEAVAHALE